MMRSHAQDLLDKFCKSIFKCSYILKQLLNPNSTISQTLVKNFDYDTTGQAKMYEAISNFDSFRQQICSNGFTLMWGLDYLKDQGEDILAQINEWVDIITRNRRRIKKFLEKYAYSIEDFGIMALLRQLAEFFNCVLSPSDTTCASIATSQNFYKKCMGALHIRETGYGTFKLTDSWVTNKLGICDNITMQLNSLSGNLSKALIDVGITSKNLANAQGAFNLANFISDCKDAYDQGNWKHIPGVKLVCSIGTGAKEMGAALSSAFTNMLNSFGDSTTESGSDVEYSFDYVLDNAVLTSNGKLIISAIVNGVTKTADVTALLQNATVTSTDEIIIPTAERDMDEYTALLQKLYMTTDKRLVSMGFATMALVHKMNGTATADELAVANDITDRVQAITNLSDTTAILKAH